MNKTLKKTTTVNKKNTICEFCNKVFSNKSNKHRHQNYQCPRNPNKKASDKAESDISGIEINDSNGVDKDVVEKLRLEMKEEITSLMTDVIKNLAQKGGLISQNHIQNQTNIQNQNINTNINIYVTEKIDFVQALRDIYGWDEAKAINHIKNRISQGDGGDVELFCDIYLFKDKEHWPLIIKDKKTQHFLLKDANNNYIQDPGGIQLHNNFRANYTDTLLRLTNREINSVLSSKEDPDFEFKRDYLMDDFDLQAVQNKAFKLCCKDGDGRGRQTFLKKLSERIEITEKRQNNSIII